MDCSEGIRLAQLKEVLPPPVQSCSSDEMTDYEYRFEMYTPRDKVEEEYRQETDSIRTEDFEKCFSKIVMSNKPNVNIAVEPIIERKTVEEDRDSVLEKDYRRMVERSKLALKNVAADYSVSSNASSVGTDLISTNELSVLQEDFVNHKKMLRKTQTELKQCRNLLEKVKAEQLLAEFKRDATLKEHETLTKQLIDAKRELNETKASNIKIDKSIDEVIDKERKNWMDKFKTLEVSLSNQLQVVVNEKDDFKKQLLNIRNDMLNEKKQWQETTDSLSQQLQQTQKKYEDASRDLNSAQKKHANLQIKLKQLEETNSEMLADKTAQHKEMKENLQSQLNEIKSTADIETDQVRQQLTKALEELTEVKCSLAEKQHDNDSLNNQIKELQIELKSNDQKLTTLAEDAQKALTASLNESKRVMEAEREKIEEEKNKSLFNLQEQFKDAQEAHKQTLEVYQSQIDVKTEQHEQTKEKLEDANEIIKDLQEQMRNREEEYHMTSLAEMKQWKSEKKKHHEAEMNALRAELNQINDSTKQELFRERSITERQSEEIERLHEEMNKLQTLLDDTIYSKQSALADLRHELTIKKHKELSQIKNCAENQTLLDCDKQKRLLKNVEKQLATFRKERNDAITKEREVTSRLDRYEKQTVSQMNDECRQIIEYFAIQVPTNEGGSNNRRSSFASSIAYLRNIIEELKRNHQAIKTEAKQLKQLLISSERKRLSDVDKIRESFHKDKMAALDALKERLIAEHVEQINKLQKTLSKSCLQQEKIVNSHSQQQNHHQSPSPQNTENNAHFAQKFHDDFRLNLEKQLSASNAVWQTDKIELENQILNLKNELSGFKFDDIYNPKTNPYIRTPTSAKTRVPQEC
ncbi:DgyrCDS709 [Dimorphilus gyrociliatus]|uniref:DgyrCDS709 n=1 Tax=Dimorphilus gyrociliatus TaxID=2664684 RepID=A0A7I8V571_9ANNE|nr:DgyrCDS709 [Dimorphilus gyrociliatus]